MRANATRRNPRRSWFVVTCFDVNAHLVASSLPRLAVVFGRTEGAQEFPLGLVVLHADVVLKVTLLRRTLYDAFAALEVAIYNLHKRKRGKGSAPNLGFGSSAILLLLKSSTILGPGLWVSQATEQYQFQCVFDTKPRARVHSMMSCPSIVHS